MYLIPKDTIYLLCYLKRKPLSLCDIWNQFANAVINNLAAGHKSVFSVEMLSSSFVCIIGSISIHYVVGLILESLIFLYKRLCELAVTFLS